MDARLLASVGIALLLSAPVGAASAVAERERILDAWVEVLLGRDPDAIAAMPERYPGIGEADRLALAQEVLARVVAQDPEVAAQLGDPALPEPERRERLAMAERLLARLMFERAALLRELREDHLAEEPAPAAPPLPFAPVGDAAATDALRRAIEGGARLPESLAAMARAPAALPLGALDAPLPAPLEGLLGSLPPGASFAVCYKSSTAQGCTGALPMLVPAPVDVTGDRVPDVLASLAPVVDPSLEPPGLQSKGLALRIDRLPPLVRLTALPALVVGVMAFGEHRVLAGYDAWSPGLPPGARDAPGSFFAIAQLEASPAGQEASFVLRVDGAGPALRVLGGTNPPGSVLDPDKFVAADLSPVPSTTHLGLVAERVGSTTHFEFSFEASAPTDLVAQAVEKLAADRVLRVQKLSAGDLDVAFTLSVDRDEDTGAETWDWQATAPLARLEYAAETTRFLDEGLGSPASWRKHALVLEGLPAMLRVEVPGVGQVHVIASALVGSVGHVLHTYDYLQGRETFDSTVARGLAVELRVRGEGARGSVGTEVGAALQRLEVQTASLEQSPAPGSIARLLFDLSEGITNFLGIRGETPTGGRALALRVLEAPKLLQLELGRLDLGLKLRLLLSARLPGAEGIVHVDEHFAALQLSSLPRDIALSGRFAPGVVEFGYTANEGIDRALVSYTNLQRAGGDRTKVHAFAQLAQLPSALSLAVTRQLDAPALRYAASASTLDVRALVDDAVFGDVRARVLVAVENLGADTSAGLVERAGKRVLRMDSVPRTDLFFLEGLVSFPVAGTLDRVVDGGWYELRYGYDLDAVATLQNLRFRLAGLRWMEAELEQPNVALRGSFAGLTVAWDALELRGPTSAWLRVDIIILWFRINVWNWGWSAPNVFSLNVDITPFHAHWAELVGIDVLWCRLSLDTIPHPHETMRNALSLGAVDGETWYLFLNPLDAKGQRLVPYYLAVGFMVWKYGDWRLALRC